MIHSSEHDPISNNTTEDAPIDETVLETETEEVPAEEKNHQGKFWLAIVVVVAVIGLIWHFITKHFKKAEPKTTTKGSLVKYYNVNKRTFEKWLVLFCDLSIVMSPDGKHIRKFTDSQVAYIKKQLGDPSICPVMNKGQIVDKTEGDYKKLRHEISSFPRLYGISIEDFSQLSVFPPSITQRIIEQFGGTGLV